MFYSNNLPFYIWGQQKMPQFATLRQQKTANILLSAV